MSVHPTAPVSVGKLEPPNQLPPRHWESPAATSPSPRLAAGPQVALESSNRPVRSKQQYRGQSQPKTCTIRPLCDIKIIDWGSFSNQVPTSKLPWFFIPFFFQWVFEHSFIAREPGLIILVCQLTPSSRPRAATRKSIFTKFSSWDHLFGYFFFESWIWIWIWSSAVTESFEKKKKLGTIFLGVVIWEVDELFFQPQC